MKITGENLDEFVQIEEKNEVLKKMEEMRHSWCDMIYAFLSDPADFTGAFYRDGKGEIYIAQRYNILPQTSCDIEIYDNYGYYKECIYLSKNECAVKKLRERIARKLQTEIDEYEKKWGEKYQETQEESYQLEDTFLSYSLRGGI